MNVLNITCYSILFINSSISFLLGDACIPSPCQNGGSCVFDEPTGSFRCYCPPTYTGRTCDIRKFFHIGVMGVLHECACI